MKVATNSCHKPHPNPSSNDLISGGPDCICKDPQESHSMPQTRAGLKSLPLAAAAVCSFLLKFAVRADSASLLKFSQMHKSASGYPAPGGANLSRRTVQVMEQLHDPSQSPGGYLSPQDLWLCPPSRSPGSPWVQRSLAGRRQPPRPALAQTPHRWHQHFPAHPPI